MAQIRNLSAFERFEVGLASYLLGLETPLHVSRDPLRGNLFENLVVADVMKSRLNAERIPICSSCERKRDSRWI